MKNKQILEIKNLDFYYKKEQYIYKNFNLTLCKGEIKSIVGSSGSGKSTLFELITNNLVPINGSINVAKVSSVYQDPYSSFHPTYNIIDQINDVAQYTNEELKQTLKQLSLQNDILNKKPHSLSGGQLLRCSILRAVLMKPDLILADEPTSALDNIIALDTMKMLIGFLDNFGILLITHDEELAKWCSDDIINIEKID